MNTNAEITVKSRGSLKGLALCLVVVLTLSWISSLPVSANMQWYDSLQKPWFNPPAWSFGVVWPLLYIMITVAAWLLWAKRDKDNLEHCEEAIAVFIFQLAVNLFWTVFFFAANSAWLGLLWIGMLWFLLIMTLLAFRSVSILATLLLVPYACWVTFAAYLNYTIWVMN